MWIKILTKAASCANKPPAFYPAAAFEPNGLLTAAGQGLFVPEFGREPVRGDGQGIGAGGASVDTSHRAVAVSWPGGSRDCCCGYRASCCCDSPTGSSAHCCSSCRRGSRGCRLFLPLAVLSEKISYLLFVIGYLILIIGLSFKDKSRQAGRR